MKENKSTIFDFDSNESKSWFNTNFLEMVVNRVSKL